MKPVQHKSADTVRNSFFTFYELLIALTLFGLVVPVVVQAFLTAQRVETYAERKLTAYRLGESLLTQLVVDRSGGIDGEGEFETAPGYRWKLEKAEWLESQTEEFELTVLRVYFRLKGDEYSVVLSTYLQNEEDVYETVQ